MSIVNKLLKIAGKDNFEIDNRIGTWYIIRQCWKYGWMMIRGKAVSLGYPGIAGNVFVGHKVKLYEKRYLKLGSKVKIHDSVRINALSSDGVSIGDNCVIGGGTVIECTGGLSNLGKGVKIGDRTTFNNDCFFGAAGGIEIGDDVVAGQFVRFHSQNHNYDNLDVLIKVQGVKHKGIKIGDNCWIGSGTVFLDGAVLGNGCVVAANTVVTKEFSENSVIGGVPAKILKKRGEK
jgi:Acetyltransferase (isoleucine patch superfamily)